MYAPGVHDHGLELRGDTRLEYALVHVGRDAVTVIEENERLESALTTRGHVYGARMRIASVA